MSFDDVFRAIRIFRSKHESAAGESALSALTERLRVFMRDHSCLPMPDCMAYYSQTLTLSWSNKNYRTPNYFSGWFEKVVCVDAEELWSSDLEALVARINAVRREAECNEDLIEWMLFDEKRRRDLGIDDQYSRAAALVPHLQQFLRSEEGKRLPLATRIKFDPDGWFTIQWEHVNRVGVRRLQAEAFFGLSQRMWYNMLVPSDPNLHDTVSDILMQLTQEASVRLEDDGTRHDGHVNLIL